MKLHHTVIERLIGIFTTYGGHRDEVRLREKLQELELDTYTQKQHVPSSTFVVLFEDVEAAKKKQNG